jgi:hypothetical protein
VRGGTLAAREEPTRPIERFPPCVLPIAHEAAR